VLVKSSTCERISGSAKDARERRTCTRIGRTREEIRLNRDVHVNARARVHASRRNNKLYRVKNRVRCETFPFVVGGHGDRQIQADSDMSIELLLVLLYISTMARVG